MPPGRTAPGEPASPDAPGAALASAVVLAPPGATASDPALHALFGLVLDGLGRSFDDPPSEQADARALRGTARHAERGRELLESAAGQDTVVWAEPLGALLLPFWSEIAAPRTAAVLLVAEPAEAARSLASAHGLGVPTALALCERYLRLAVRHMAGMPAFVCPVTDGGPGPGEQAERIARWLCSLGLGEEGGLQALSGELERAIGLGAPSPRGGGAEVPVLDEQSRLLAALTAAAGPHLCFEAPDLGAESAWTTEHLSQRHETMRLWSALDWLAGACLEASAPGPCGPSETSGERRRPPGDYPASAWEDVAGYHAWLQRRGEPTRLPPAPPAAGGGEEAGSGDRSSSPRFSVVLALCRPGGRAGRCIESVLSQDHPSFELIVVDEGSPEGEPGVRSQAAGASDRRVHHLRRGGRSGLAGLTNEGIAAARGELVVFLGQDDELAAGALSSLEAGLRVNSRAQLLYSDEDAIDEEGSRSAPRFKPDWSPDLLLSNAYVGGLLAVRRDLLQRLGGLSGAHPGAEEYDLTLRASEQLSGDEIVHLPEVLYHRRAGRPSAPQGGPPAGAAAKAGREALVDALERRGIDAEVTDHPSLAGSWFVRRRVKGRPLVSAVVPFRDEPELLASFYRSFVESPGHDDFELLLTDNDSCLPETEAVVARLCEDPRVRVIASPGPFNWARINNVAAAQAKGDVLLFLNNDVEARSEGWLAHLLAEAQRPEVGAAGARLVFPDGRLQHGGLALGVFEAAGHLQEGLPGSLPGYLGWVSVIRDTSAVTGACLMTRREVFEELEGFDTSFPIAFNDVDYCLRARERGLLVVYTPLAVLVHHESASTGHTDGTEIRERFWERWAAELPNDPYYNVNLSRSDQYCRLPSEEDEERWETFRSMLSKWSPS